MFHLVFIAIMGKCAGVLPGSFKAAWNDIEIIWRKKINHAFSMVYTLKNHGVLTN